MVKVGYEIVVMPSTGECSAWTPYSNLATTAIY